MSVELGAVGRLVVAPPNWLGDAVLALPAMAALRRAASSAHLTLAAPPAVAAIFREITDVRPDDVLELPSGSRASMAALREGRFDLAVLFPNSFGSAWRYRRAGIRERWGYASSGRGVLLTRRARRPKRRDRRHMIDYYRALVRGLGVPVGDDVPRIAASAESAAAAGRLLTTLAGGSRSTGALSGGGSSPLVVLAPGAAYGQAKQWPPERMAELIARLAARNIDCALVGAPHDRAAARAIESWLRAHAAGARARVIDLVGRTTLGALVGVAARADVFVSNDSGAMHVAAALGRPVVAIFGPTDERATGPIGAHDVLTEPVFCRPCLLRDCPIDHRCMKRITVDRVAAAVFARLEAARS